MDQAILDSYYAALKAGDFAALERLLTPGVCVRYYGPPGLLPWGGVHEGFDAYRRFLGLVREHLEIIEVVQEAVIAEGEWIVVLGRGAWRARATGRDITASMTNVFRIDGGRIAEYRVYTDTAAFAAALAP
ncbi:MAG TPA: nuclear transport factor 2 family protein [Ferrovibrio sp.]|uniref:nuclear transport factor 2 family protein n=1 Tax=Ferrovibrio sp. TaxID=1917215 RepID=UPI002B4ACF07|nr:nuclear transport factor 2 family protein [Ferrovibrio sp.]HLT77614.1 nuclear transport factor 2 family protein [Ferrovibrio sp.]